VQGRDSRIIAVLAVRPDDCGAAADINRVESMNPVFVQPFKAALLVVTILGLSACASKSGPNSGIFEPYKLDIQQGNYITADAVKQLKQGMTQEQVRNILGSPLILDPFRADRWDYVFHYQQANGKTDTRRAAVFFKEGRVTKVDATELPASEAADDPILRRGRTS
jgi:outer membrane protein assembly factor BamE